MASNLAHYQMLFTPLRIGSIEVPNRIFSSAHATNFGDAEGLWTDRHLAYYEARARGGLGLIITGCQSVSRYSSPPIIPFDRCVDDRQIPRYRRVTEAVHRHDTRIFAQLWHFGRQASSVYQMLPLQGASPAPCPLTGEFCQEMEHEDIERTVEEFAAAAVRCREGGFDGIEIHGAHGYLLASFLSPASNFRSDEYGGSLENRMRFPLQVLHAVRKAVGDDFVVGFKLSGDEFISGGLTAEDSCEISRHLQEQGTIDFVGVSVGVYATFSLIIGPMYLPLGFAVPLAARIKETATVPVLAIHRIKDPAHADEILRSGHADMVAMTRATICDPELPRKAKEGREAEIRNCIACNQGCWGRVSLGLPLSCALNPTTGRETDPEWRTVPSPLRRRVTVVGGGPAGAEAARVAALRGHRVTLYEQGLSLGGQLLLAQRASGREELQDVVRYYDRELRRLGVEIRLNTCADVPTIREEWPDAVIVATGARPLRQPFPPLPPIGGVERNNVFTIEEVLEGNVDVGSQVVVYATEYHLRGPTTADTLADRGKHVTLIVPTPFAAPHADNATWSVLMGRLAQKGVAVTTSTAVTAVETDRVRTLHLLGNREGEVPCDSLVLALGGQAEDGLYHDLRGVVADLHRIGDCLAPRRLEHAIYEGSRVGRLV